VGFWELMSKIDLPNLAAAGLIGTGFVIVVFALATIVTGTTKQHDDVEIVRMRFAQVMFVGIITIMVFSSLYYIYSYPTTALVKRYLTNP
jgi:hypothetical protein